MFVNLGKVGGSGDLWSEGHRPVALAIGSAGGETETISYRQGLYFGFIALSVAGSTLAVWLQRLLNRPTRPTARGLVHWPLALAFYVVYAAMVYVIMPANPDPVEMPAQLVWTFRAISLGGLILFWGALGGAFVWLSREPAFAFLWRRTT